MTVRAMVVAVDVVLVLGGSGAGAGAPVVSICPASAVTASVRLRIVATHIRRKGFIFVAPREFAKSLQRNPISMIGLTKPCKARTDYVRFALGFALFPCNLEKAVL
jgi:hypothetical protein